MERKRVTQADLRSGMEILEEGKPYPEAALGVTFMEGKGMRLFPIGGGFALKPELVDKHVFHEVTEEQKAPRHRRDLFGFDEGPDWPGWHTGRTWNGWGMPLFEEKEARAVFEYMEGWTWKRYHEPDDAFYIFDESYSEDGPDAFTVIKGEDVEIDGQVRHVYDFGSAGWCWNLSRLEGL